MEGMAYWLWAEVDYKRKRDPREHTQKAVAAAERSIKAHPERHQGYLALANAWSALADNWDIPHGEDPRPSLQKAVAAYESALKLYSDNTLYSNLANALSNMARWEIEHGQEYLPTVERSLKSYEAAARLDKKMLSQSVAQSDCCYLLSDAALAELEAGHDPTALLDRAEKHCRLSHDQDKTLPHALSNLVLVEWVRGLQLAKAGRDPLPPLDEGIAAGNAAMALKGAPAFAFEHSSRALLLRARLTPDAALSAKLLAQARTTAEKAVALDGEAVSLAQLAEVALAEKKLPEAARTIEKALAIRANYLRGLNLAAEIAVAQKDQAKASAFVTRALAVNPKSARALELRAALK